MSDAEDAGSDVEEDVQTTTTATGLDGSGGAAAGGNAAGATAAKKKKKKKTAATKKRDYEAFFKHALESTAGQVAGLSLEERKRPSRGFEMFLFTGTVRPWHVTKQMRVPPHIPKPDYAETGQPLGEQAESPFALPHVYSGTELAKLRKVCAIGAEVLALAGRFLRAGVTGDEIDRVVYTAIVERGAYPSPLNYYNFPKSVCVSVNEIICHGIPDCRPVQDGDIVNIDVSVYYDGMHADLNETFMVGNVDEDGRHLVRTAFSCLQAAARMIKPGVFYRDLGNEIQRVATANNCGVVRRYQGHGCGRLFHTKPDVPHYKDNKAPGIMKAGHVFTVEPMINLGGSGNTHDVTWPDKWTSATRNGLRSAQFEHMFLVTETGCEVLTARSGFPTNDLVWNGAYEELLQRPGAVTVAAAAVAAPAAEPTTQPQAASAAASASSSEPSTA